MSALVGLLSQDWPQTERRKALLAMSHALEGRGTEPFASWSLESEPVALGIRELVTRDLTPDGRQPALSSQKPIAVILDGVIGNAASLRRDLEEAGIKPRGHGDAELLAELVAEFGLNLILQRLEGSFAFALWDGEAQALHLVRDRMGGKPLCVTRQGNTIAFASRPDAFEGLAGYQKQLNPDAVAAYLTCGYSHGTTCLLKDIVILPPGHRLMLRAEDTAIPAPESWWSPATALEEIALRGAPATRLDRLLGIITSETVQADVPFLTLDDGSQEARNLSTYLGQKSDKPQRSLPLMMPDAVSVQTAFEITVGLPLPVADPDSCLLVHTFRNQPDMAGNIVFSSCPSAILNGENVQPAHFTIPRPISRLAAKLMPRHFAHQSADALTMAIESHGYWPCHENPADPHFSPVFEIPRLPMGQRDLALCFGMDGPLRKSRLPMLDALAGLYNLDLRAPLADHRILDYQIPTLQRSKADIAGWMRGPLRVRMQNTLNNMHYEMLHIKNRNVIMTHWQKFLSGDNSNVHGLWAWLTLCTWVSTHRLT
jgi:hypothetical protein